MIWLNLKEAERKLSSKELTDNESFKYLLGICILSSINVPQHFFNDWLRDLDTILSILIIVWGLNKIYQTNNLVDGQEFYKRLFVLSWVIGWRITIYLILPMVIIKLICEKAYNYNIETHITAQTIETILYALIAVIYFMLLNNSFKKLLPEKAYEALKTS